MRKAALLLVLSLASFGQDRVDLALVDRIKAEAFERSKVMETLRNLSDVHGPRLTGSPGFEDAAKWAMGELNWLWPRKSASRKVGTLRPRLDARTIVARDGRAALLAAHRRAASLERLDQRSGHRRPGAGAAVTASFPRRSQEIPGSLAGVSGRSGPESCAARSC